MADNLPLIPEKKSVCTDVKPVLREVFRELDGLPPLVSRRGTAEPSESQLSAGSEDGDHALPAVNLWVDTYASECEELRQQEGGLKQQHARRLARAPAHNAFRLDPRQAPTPEPPPWLRERGVLQRSDLQPTVEQDAGRDASLWIQNILNRSSGDLRPGDLPAGACRGHPPPRLHTPTDSTVQTLSIGEVVTRAPPAPAPQPPAPPAPEYIVCLPPQLDFVNFTVGQLHTQMVRLVNVSKFEIRVSLRPPRRRELDVQLCGARGLAVSSGAAAELRVHFRPRDVRAVYDALHVRASIGRPVVVPVACYMRPPRLLISVPMDTSSAGLRHGSSELGTRPGRDVVLELGTRPGRDAVLELGARLLGDVHCVRLLVGCDAEHAAFFLLTEDSWLSHNLDCLTSGGSVAAGPFAVWPAWWAGGGAVHACAWCHARAPGVHAAALRVLSSTAATRPLHLLADALHWRPEHITIEAHEKDYDILSAEDAACRYHVQLGSAFPGRPLAASVRLRNHSPLSYSYYWRVRPWGVCSCWTEEQEMESLSPEDYEDQLCLGAKQAAQHGVDGGGLHEGQRLTCRQDEREQARASAALLSVESGGELSARGTERVFVRVRGAGARCGTQRAVLMLILKDIPKESIPPDVDPMIVSTEEVPTPAVPGLQSHNRAVCEVVCCQMEVWWEVVPVRFVLDPPVLPLLHSRRLESLAVVLRGTQLSGGSGGAALELRWRTPAHVPVPPPAHLAPAHVCTYSLTLPLPSLPEDREEEDVITALAAGDEWQSQCAVRRRSTTRHPALRPASSWLGVLPPGARVRAALRIRNDTYQHICWWGEIYRWWGELPPKPVCAGRAPCEQCHECACTCAILRPTRGALPHLAEQDICYDVNAPECDGCVASVVRVSRVRVGAGSAARAALLAYRVLAPRLVLRLCTCLGDEARPCAGCSLAGARAARAARVLRPPRALALARRACYRLRVRNVTPIATALHWEPPPDGDEFLKVLFIPNQVNIGSYGEVEIQVVLEARKVCGRRMFVCRGQVAHAACPVYLLVDAAISGLEVTCEVPLGAAVHCDSSVILRRTQKEEYPWEPSQPRPPTVAEMFADDDRKRRVVKANICQCAFKMMYIPPEKRHNVDDSPCIDIVSEPPSLTRVCPCFHCAKPVLPDHLQPLCLQFQALPLRTVGSRTLVLRNESVLTGRWTAAVRRWPRRRARGVAAGGWAASARAPGVVVQCAPRAGLLAAHARALLHVSVYADCWGLYYDQLLVKIDQLEPIVIDVWVEALGPPLQLALRPSDSCPEEPPALWVSASDPQRSLRAKNTSRSELLVHTYVLQQHADEVAAEESDLASSYTEEMDTGIEVYLAADVGVQLEDIDFKVTPEVTTVEAGQCFEWQVKLVPPAHSEIAPPAILLMRILPVDNIGPAWCRPEPPPRRVQLLQPARAGRLRASCAELRVRLCALALPFGDVMRVRKRLQLLNVGDGPLQLAVRTSAPWSVLRERARRGACGCTCLHEPGEHDERGQLLPLHLEPRSSQEMCVEVSIRTSDAWPPAPPAAGHEWARSSTPLHVHDRDDVLLSVPLLLQLEFPVLRLEPATVDFGFVTDGDSRKTYLTVSHTSRSETIDVSAEWAGSSEFQLWPPSLDVAPGASERLYLQYTAVWRSGAVEGCVRVRARGAAGAWCRAEAVARAAPTRERSHAHAHVCCRLTLP